MRTTPDPTDTPVDLTGQKQAPVPAPAPQAKHLHDSIWQKPDGMLETRGYPMPKPKTPAFGGQGNL